MALLDSFKSEVQGYFRNNDEESFPWESTDRSVWYALITVEDGKLQNYGFTSAEMQKYNLLQALQKLGQCGDALLLGIWTGRYRTDLFILNIDVAKKKLKNLN